MLLLTLFTLDLLGRLLDRTDRSERGDVIPYLLLGILAVVVIGVVLIPGVKGLATDVLADIQSRITNAS